MKVAYKCQGHFESLQQPSTNIVLVWSGKVSFYLLKILLDYESKQNVPTEHNFDNCYTKRTYITYGTWNCHIYCQLRSKSAKSPKWMMIHKTITEQTFHIIILLKYENKRQAICKWARPNNKYSARGKKRSPTQKEITLTAPEARDGCAREPLIKEEDEEYATTRKVRLGQRRFQTRNVSPFARE